MDILFIEKMSEEKLGKKFCGIIKNGCSVSSFNGKFTDISGIDSSTLFIISWGISMNGVSPLEVILSKSSEFILLFSLDNINKNNCIN
jgi:hypothetical protein